MTKYSLGWRIFVFLWLMTTNGAHLSPSVATIENTTYYTQRHVTDMRFGLKDCMKILYDDEMGLGDEAWCVVIISSFILVFCLSEDAKVAKRPPRLPSLLPNIEHEEG